MSKEINNWSVASLWNETFNHITERVLEPRNYVYASEIGKSPWEVLRRMQGIQPSTPPDKRSKRKFEAGNFFEWIAKQILVRSGITISQQERITDVIEGVEIHGKADFISSSQSLSIQDMGDMPEFFGIMQKLLVESMDGVIFTEQGIEIKSISEMGMSRIERDGQPYDSHGMQSYYYARTTKKNFILECICRDDLRMISFIIPPFNAEAEANLINWCQRMKHAIDNNYAEKEPLLLVDDEYKVSKNFDVEWSYYLNEYGFELPSDYADEAKRITTRMSNAFKTIKGGKKLTKNNLEAIELTKQFYPDIQKYIDKLYIELANGRTFNDN